MPLNFPKVDRVPLPSGADPDEYIVAADWNSLCDYIEAIEARTITAGVGLSGGGDLSASRTIDLENTAVTPGAYTNADITVDAQGRITAAANGSAGGATTLTGDVTGTGTGTFATTIANDAVTYAKMQNVSATQRALGRNTAGAGDVEEVTASQLLDWIGTTRGAVLYRGAAGWAALSPGTSGHVLTSNGAGADPSYQAAAGGGTIGGTIATGQIGYASGADTLAGEANLFWNTTDNRLGINTAGSPAATLDVRTSETGQHPVRIQNDSASAHSAVSFYNDAGTGGAVKGALGYANASVAGARASKMHLTLASGVDFLVTDTTFDYLYVKQSATAPQFVFGSSTATASRYFDIKQPALNAAANVQALFVQGGAHTALSAGTSWRGAAFAFNQTVQWDTGGVGSGNIRALNIFPPTIAFVGASTAVDATTVYISGAPTAGTNATITDAYALWIDDGRVRIDQGVALGAAGTATLGATGGSGPTATAQNEWIAITTQNGRRFVPAWA